MNVESRRPSLKVMYILHTLYADLAVKYKPEVDAFDIR